MYARRRLNVTQSDHQEPEERYSVTVTRGGKPVDGIHFNRITHIEERVMYWRKANHIHGWFVDNVQDGDDDCREYHVGLEQLRELHGICQKVIKASKLVEGMVHKYETWDAEKQAMVVHRQPGKLIEDPSVAKKLLPRQAGFFFGVYEYDEEYLDDVISTRSWLNAILKDIKNGVPGEIYYQSSW